MRTVQLEHSWRTLLEDQFEQPYMRQLREFLLDEKRAGHQVFPAGKNMFTALNLVPLERAKVVIIGQDPYHGPGQAHGPGPWAHGPGPWAPQSQKIQKQFEIFLNAD